MLVVTDKRRRIAVDVESRVLSPRSHALYSVPIAANDIRTLPVRSVARLTAARRERNMRALSHFGAHRCSSSGTIGTGCDATTDKRIGTDQDQGTRRGHSRQNLPKRDSTLTANTIAGIIL